MAKAERACLDADWQIQALHQQQCDDLQRGQGYQEVATLLRKNRRREKEVLNAMMKEEAKKVRETYKRLVSVLSQSLPLPAGPRSLLIQGRHSTTD